MARISEDDLLVQRAVQMKLLTQEQFGRCVAAQKKLLAAGKNVSLAAIAKAAKYLTPQQLEQIRKSLNAEEALPRLGGFEILARIGKGGMGYVFKARQISMDRIVALKILPPRLAKDKKFVERFHREAKAAARLSHTNIIQSIDVGEQDGHHYFAMEYVEGPTVEEILAKTGRMDENLATDVILQIARAIQAAEKLKIVHLDIKPSNIMITPDRVAKLADFGLARRWTDSPNQDRQNIVYGTPEYISPEQALGYTDLDSRSDIYSLGATFYHMLTGEPPFKGRTPREIVDQRLTTAPPHPKQLNPNLSDQICQVLDKMLQRDRNYRYQNASELIEDLEFIQRSRAAQAVWPMAMMPQQGLGAQQGEVLYEEVSSIIEPGALRKARRPSTASMAAGILALLILLGMAGAGIYIYYQEPQLWAQMMKFLGVEPPPKRPAQGPRLYEAPPAQPTPVAPLPAVPTPTAPVGGDDAAGKTEAQKCLAEADKSLAAGKYKDALEVLERYPERWRSQYYGYPVVEKLNEVKLKIEAMFNQDLAQAKNLRREGKLAESRALMEKIKGYLPLSMTEEYAEYQDSLAKLERAEEKAAPVQEQKKAEDVSKLRAEVKSAAADLLRAGKFDDALTKLQTMNNDPKYAPVKADLALEMQDVIRVREFAAALAQGAGQLIGQTISVKGIAGYTLKGVNGNEITVALAGKDQPPVKFEDLKGGELIALAQGYAPFNQKDKGEQSLMCALYLRAIGQSEKANVEFEAARKAGVDVSRYVTALAPRAAEPSKKVQPPKKPTR